MNYIHLIIETEKIIVYDPMYKFLNFEFNIMLKIVCVQFFPPFK